ncbi:MAG: META domain-containing protein [Anaerolineaceae bacterium]
MNKILLIILILFVGVLLLGVLIMALFTINRSEVVNYPVSEFTPSVKYVENTETLAPNLDIMTGYKDITVDINGIPIKLSNGQAEMESAPGSSKKTIFRYFGNESFGDLNGDGKEDVAFLFTQEAGGSGTFFYVVAALQIKTGYEGTNAVLLGDRIAPQSTSILEGEILVNFADRQKDEPFTTQPSVGISKYFKINDSKLIETINFTQIANREWIWVSSDLNDASSIMPNKTDAFRITFQEDGSFTGTTDCNSFFGHASVEKNKLVFGPIGSTKMACEGAQENAFLSTLAEVDNFRIDFYDNRLVFLMKNDSGLMTFK